MNSGWICACPRLVVWAVLERNRSETERSLRPLDKNPLRAPTIFRTLRSAPRSAPAHKWVQMHLLFKQRGAGRENDNCVGLKLAKNTYVAPGAALRRIHDRAQCILKYFLSYQWERVGYIKLKDFSFKYFFKIYILIYLIKNTDSKVHINWFYALFFILIH